ncbi:MAG: hypothetical protein SGJ20_10380 [Planctomycetota bacterium]|nr:hypothetical protein [Planctomycetota bacterium]
MFVLPRGWLSLVLGCVIALCGLGSVARAGGGPETLILVVNSRSQASMAVANYFVELRKIPSTNICYVDWKGSTEETDIETFRTAILTPVLKFVEQRGLAPHLDGIIYSSDFPYRITFDKDLPKEALQRGDLAKAQSGSITGLTYLWQQVLAKDPRYVYFDTNRYHRFDNSGQPLPTHGFRGWYGWSEDNQLLESGGRRYFLSTMLGVTGGRGNTPNEVIKSLQRSASADGTAPEGSFWYSDNGDVRATTRKPLFEPAVAELTKLGFKAGIIQAVSPEDSKNCMGVMLGSATFDWPRSRSTLLAGSLADNLTSYGADFSNPPIKGNMNQTPISEFIRYGASGSAGTPSEPTAMAMKFPDAFLFVHYVRGASLAEAFYQSVRGPYQLLVVGDPLCQPYAKIPTIAVAGFTADQTVKGEITLTPTATGGEGTVDRYSLYVDGVQTAICGQGDSLKLDTAAYSDGSHEIRVVGVSDDAIETQGRLILPLEFSNHDRKIQLTATPANVRLGQKVTFAAESPGASTIVLHYNGRPLGQIKGAKGEISVNTAYFGMGPVNVRAVAITDGAVKTTAWAKPVQIQATDR